jgi:lipid II:glycine glycyltransferase (peptidoglycan interpeptide bridge formation enzyme)
MSSYNYKYIQITRESALDTDKNWDGTSFWQSPLWAEILGKTHQARDIVLCSGESGEILLERRTIIGKYTGLYALGVDGKAINKELLEYIKAEIRQDNDLFLQIEPLETVNSELWTVNSKKNPPLFSFIFSFFSWNKAPFRRFIEPVTAVLGLNTDEEKLLASFAEKGRYNIRLAQKRWIMTKWVSSNTKRGEKTYLEAFYSLLEETTERDKFSHNSLSYYQHFIETLEAYNAGWLLVAEKDGILHAAGIFVYSWETAIYYYGASSSDRDIRRDMATYLLQWEAIREGMKRNCTTYDFLGISEDGKGKLAWVTEFKLRFNPEKVHLPSEVVVAYRPMLLKVLQVVSRVRKLFR